MAFSEPTYNPFTFLTPDRTSIQRCSPVVVVAVLVRVFQAAEELCQLHPNNRARNEEKTHPAKRKPQTVLQQEARHSVYAYEHEWDRKAHSIFR